MVIPLIEIDVDVDMMVYVHPLKSTLNRVKLYRLSSKVSDITYGVYIIQALSTEAGEGTHNPVMSCLLILDFHSILTTPYKVARRLVLPFAESLALCSDTMLVNLAEPRIL